MTDMRITFSAAEDLLGKLQATPVDTTHDVDTLLGLMDCAADREHEGGYGDDVYLCTSEPDEVQLQKLVRHFNLPFTEVPHE